MELKPDMRLVVGDKWPTKGGGQLAIEDYSSIKLKPEEVPGAERALEFLNNLLSAADSTWTSEGWCIPILQGLRLIRDAEGWRLTTNGYLAHTVEEGDEECR